uniref:7TM_GPCR_Srx domain-containing protein n=1 Tax=Caenorhabditis tropicalis TaxID=1561998 RepID=A0A1I7TEV0_9PELO
MPAGGLIKLPPICLLCVCVYNIHGLNNLAYWCVVSGNYAPGFRKFMLSRFGIMLFLFDETKFERIEFL